MPDTTTVPKPPISDFLNDAAGNSLIGMLAAIVRLAFARENSYKVSITTFAGGVAFAVLVGWLIKDTPWLHSYSNGIVALCALIGKEIVNTMRKKLPDALMSFLRSYIKEKGTDE